MSASKLLNFVNSWSNLGSLWERQRENLSFRNIQGHLGETEVLLCLGAAGFAWCAGRQVNLLKFGAGYCALCGWKMCQAQIRVTQGMTRGRWILSDWSVWSVTQCLSSPSHYIHTFMLRPLWGARTVIWSRDTLSNEVLMQASPSF